jgi:copper chaperone NosL
MKAKTLTCLVAISLLSCEIKPEPLIMGKDACHTCKMILMDERFGAEIVTKKGKIYKFDDLNCMIGFINSGSVSEENIEQLLVVEAPLTVKLR